MATNPLGNTDAPPTYSEAITNSSPPSSFPTHPSPTLNTQLYTAHLASHLYSIPARIREQQYARTTQQASQDLELIPLLFPHIEAFLSDLGTMSHYPPVAELTLVPEGAVPGGWEMSGVQERRREGEVVHLVRVAPVTASGEKGGSGGSNHGNEKGRNDEGSRSASSGMQFDGWGNFENDDSTTNNGGSSSLSMGPAWWWHDENQARRLASYLQPKTEPNLDRKQVQRVVEKAQEERKGWWWRKAADSDPKGASSAPVITDAKVDSSRLSKKSAEDGVTMSVRTEEVTFRMENAWGMWESMTGFGLIVSVKMRR